MEDCLTIEGETYCTETITPCQLALEAAHKDSSTDIFVGLILGLVIGLGIVAIVTLTE